jgi:hypothetical protein
MQQGLPRETEFFGYNPLIFVEDLTDACKDLCADVADSLEYPIKHATLTIRNNTQQYATTRNNTQQHATIRSNTQQYATHKHDTSTQPQNSRPRIMRNKPHHATQHNSQRQQTSRKA